MSLSQNNTDSGRGFAHKSVNCNKAVFTEQVKLLYGNGISSSFGIVTITVLVWGSLRWTTGQPYLIDAWMIYMAVVAALRLWLVLGFQQRFKAENTLLWSHYFIASAAMAGLGWGSVSLFFLIVPDATYQIAIIMIVLGIMATTVPVLSIIWPAFIVSLIPPTATLFYVIILWENQASHLLAGALALYTVLILHTARNNHETLVNTFRLQQERDELITYLDSEIVQRKNAQNKLLLHQTQLEELVKIRTRELQQTNSKLIKEIKEREKSEEKIRHAHERFTKVMDSLDSLVYVADMENHEILFMNKFARETWGEQEDNKYQKLQADQSGPCSFHCNDELLDAAGISTGVHNIEFRNEATGDWLEQRTQAITWPDGRTVRLTIASVINDRKLAEQRIKDDRAFLQSIIDGVADPILVIDKHYEVQLMNNAAREYCTEDSTPAQCRTCYQVSHHTDQPCDSSEHPCPLQNILTTGKPSTVMHKHPLGDGRIKSFEIIASPLLNKYNEITGIVQVSRDITDHLNIQNELREKQSHLDHLAHHDILTNLPNRLLFRDRLNQALHKAHRASSQFALLFIDLDNFKQINDNFGHAIGDIVLQTFALRLEKHIREIDTLARFGGDEFTLLIESLEKIQHVALVAEKLIAAIEQPFLIDQHELSITTSIGISLFPQDGEDAEALLRRADTAMYLAKKSAGNTIQFYTHETPPLT